MPKAKIPAAKRPVKRLPGPKRTVAKPKAPKPKATKTKPKPKWTQRQDGEKTFDYRTAGGKTKRRYQRVTSAGKKWGGGRFKCHPVTGANRDLDPCWSGWRFLNKETRLPVLIFTFFFIASPHF